MCNYREKQKDGNPQNDTVGNYRVVKFLEFFKMYFPVLFEFFSSYMPFFNSFVEV